MGTNGMTLGLMRRRQRKECRRGACVARTYVLGGGALLLSSSCINVIGDVEVDRADSVMMAPNKALGLDAGACTDAGLASGSCVVSCAPGEGRCQGLLLQMCNERGDGWDISDQCASSALCDASEARCMRPACAERQHLCSMTGELSICRADRTGFEHKDQCQSEAYCSSVSGRERCEGTACRAGRQRCNGPQIEQCRSDRTGFDLVGAPCASASLCQVGDGDIAQCAIAMCTAGAFACDGARLTRCADEADNFIELRLCATPELCNAAAQRCEPPKCGPGEQRCTNNVLERCNAGQTAFSPVETCASALHCDTAAPRCLTAPRDPPVLGDQPYTFMDTTGPAALGLGPLTLSVPAEWTDIDRRPWLGAAGETLGPRFIASTNAARFSSSFDIPGVYFAATASAPVGVAERLAEFDLTGRCTLGTAVPYDDGLYFGTSQTWTNCGGTTASTVVVVAAPEDNAFVAVVIVSMLAERDRLARERIWESFLVQPP